MNKTLLPLGSIIIPKEGEKKLMIISRVTHIEGHGIFDYTLSLWPEGYIDEEQIYFLNHEDIERIVHQGYSDAEDMEIVLKLSGLTEDDFM